MSKLLFYGNKQEKFIYELILTYNKTIVSLIIDHNPLKEEDRMIFTC